MNHFILLASMNIFSFVQNIQTLQAVVLLIGLALLILEVFVPGFGVAGILGIIVIIAGILLTAQTLFEALIMFLILLVILAVIAVVIIKSASKGKLNKKLVLKDRLTKEQGFSSTEDMEVFLGREGKSVTMLRPSGIGIFDGVRLDVVSVGTYIEKDAPIKITA
ncbi:MAG: hypothetical protein R6W96_04905, partial [Clostridia bacterium]